MHVAHSILEVDYAFAARRWAVPAWRVYDWLLLALALLHGFNGLRVVVDEWVRPPRLRRRRRSPWAPRRRASCSWGRTWWWPSAVPSSRRQGRV